ncbi:MAG: hypothetical protein ABJE95_16600 [Byssovorax sp.]
MIRSAPRSTLRSGVALLGAAAVIGAASPAHAVLCSTLANPVYITGGGKVAIADLAKALSSSGISLVYKLQGSCLAVDAILNGTHVGTAADTVAAYWDSSTEQKCDLDPMGQVADLGLSDVFPSTCQSLPGGLPSNVGDFFGPVEAYTFVVPKTSTQKVISKAAGYFVFGFGKDSGVEPWTDESFLFIRDASSGTQQMFGAAIGVPPLKWHGVSATSSGDLVTKIIASTKPEATIGILTAEVAGANRATLTTLAYQDVDQSCGYWTDSTPSGFDKRNVRDGHYAVWGPLHLLTKLDGNGYPINKSAGDVVAYLTGTKTAPGGFDLIALLAGAHIIPACAMQVRRMSELGPLTSFAPEQACGCYFDEVATGSTKCKVCMSDVECGEGAPKCNYGYCETQ